MGVKRCAWGECKSDSRLTHKQSMFGVFFVRFPKPKSQPDKCDRWIRACSRADDFGRHKITPDTYVCSLHFVGGKGPTLDHPDPIPATAREIQIRALERKKRKAPSDRMPIPTVPKKNPRSTSASYKDTMIEKENINKELAAVSIGTSHSGEIMDQSMGQLCLEHSYCTTGCNNDKSIRNETTPLEPTSSNTICEPTKSGSCSSKSSEDIQQEKPQLINASNQTVINLKDLRDYKDQHLKEPTLLKRHLFINDVMKDDKSCKFYTGIISLQLLMYLFNWLKPKAERLSLWKGDDTAINPGGRHDGRGRALSTFESFLLILVRLRRGFDVEHLSDVFGIAPSTISRYFRTWLEFMSRELSFLIVWPSQEQVKATLPKTFKHFKKTVGIIDCTEFFIQKPSLPSSQRITFSHYKSHNTFKALVSISPTGAFTFISDLWTGSVSDRRITEESGFLDMINYGDDIMADRGFLIRDLLAFRGGTLNIPPFAHGRQLSSAAVTKTRRIASARIHVERAIGRLKNFKILQGIFPLKSKKLANQTVKLCAQLCNLDKKLVNI